MHFVKSIEKKRPEVNPTFSDETVYWRRFKVKLIAKFLIFIF